LQDAFLINPADNPQKQLKKKSVYGAQTHFIAKVRLDGDSWDLRCIDPLVSEFRLRPGDILYFWSQQFGEWLPASEMDLIEMAVAELEKGKGTSTCE
jgi:hypothetical protein